MAALSLCDCPLAATHVVTKCDMTDSNTNAVPQRIKKLKRPKSHEAWSKLAQRRGVSTRTLDRWADDGIISKPEIINGRKYGDPDEAPRLDVGRPRRLPPRRPSSPEAA